ncbi:MAG TPA: hypothetical protein VHO70_24425, partial [Chitinispirillaceae bacterium]|nr:hypothetical protein [Chitinispirillaceae bacterium]
MFLSKTAIRCTIWPVVLFLFTNISNCTLPQDPGAPSNTRITPFVRTMDGGISIENATDSAGKMLSIGAALYLPQNFTTIYLSVKMGGQSFLDTSFSTFNINEPDDTIQVPVRFFTPGIYVATFTPVSNPVRDPVSVKITVLPKNDTSSNRRPSMSITGNTILRPGEKCLLDVSVSDPDPDQVLSTVP